MKTGELSNKSWRKFWKGVSHDLVIKLLLSLTLTILHLLKMERPNSGSA